MLAWASLAALVLYVLACLLLRRRWMRGIPPSDSSLTTPPLMIDVPTLSEKGETEAREGWATVLYVWLLTTRFRAAASTRRIGRLLRRTVGRRGKPKPFPIDVSTAFFFDLSNCGAGSSRVAEV